MKVAVPNKVGLFDRPLVAEWLGTAGLLLLSAVPIIAGAARVTELAGGAEITADNARFFASPLPVLIHIVSASLYAILGAFQFAPAIRRNQPARHRAIGLVLVPSGLAVALSGLWMTLFYPWPESAGEILYGMRLLFGSAMTLFICLGYIATRHRNFVWHGVWMTRAYAIGLGAGTQVLTHIPYFLLFGVPDELTTALLMGAGWVINLMVAEWFIHKRLAQTGRQMQMR